jgi:hypothetical protein
MQDRMASDVLSCFQTAIGIGVDVLDTKAIKGRHHTTP